MAEKLREHDIAVFLVPEAASLIFQGGGMIKTGSYNDDDAISFQVKEQFLVNLVKKTINLDHVASNAMPFRRNFYGISSISETRGCDSH